MVCNVRCLFSEGPKRITQMSSGEERILHMLQRVGYCTIMLDRKGDGNVCKEGVQLTLLCIGCSRSSSLVNEG